MAELIAAIGYVFAYCRRRPRSAIEAAELPAVASQVQMLRRATTEGRVRLEKTAYDLPTNRQSVFFERRRFVEVVQEASARGLAVAVADLSWLLGTVTHKKFTVLGDMLQNSGALIWDVSRRRYWDSLPKEEQMTIMSEAARGNVIRSRNIKSGLTKRTKSSKQAAKANARKGTNANSLRSANLALQLQSVVQEVRLQQGDALSPTALAAALNERQIPSPRGGRWSHNSAKNLILRIDRLRKGELAST
ncbi:hypothetical protein [Aquibium oceanicum]|uniref:Resolvase/invertase-type recombinase catalytic domain-containing protein n=1 Tax=Aquibium oceanicum TaxID=1670800 RepID=A0A1L3SVJ1_9HYPH|nr:hypothetical protein [Aquibium oceanicum]APH73400.1 hypothetical protein BSQ44_19990 [Aquibium oceanicum]